MRTQAEEIEFWNERAREKEAEQIVGDKARIEYWLTRARLAGYSGGEGAMILLLAQLCQETFNAGRYVRNGP
jgi:hypothetical protein